LDFDLQNEKKKINYVNFSLIYFSYPQISVKEILERIPIRINKEL